MENKKILNIEILRVMAIIAVVLIHMTIPYFYDINLMNGNYTAWAFNNLYNAISRFCVPVFFIISAYLSFNGKSSKGVASRIKRLAIPYISWSAIYFLYNGGSDIIEFIKKITTSNTSFHLWFLPPFIGYTLLLPAIKKMVSLDDGESQKYIIIIITIASILPQAVIYAMNTFYGDYSFLSGVNNFGLSFPSLLTYAIAFPLLYRKVSITKCVFLYSAMVALNLLVSLLVSEKTGKTDTFFYGYTTPFVFISSFILFNIIMSADLSFISGFAKKTIISIGDCSFGVYLSHWIVYLILGRYGMVFTGRAIIDPLLNTVIVFLISFYLIYALKKIKYLRMFM